MWLIEDVGEQPKKRTIFVESGFLNIDYAGAVCILSYSKERPLKLTKFTGTRLVSNLSMTQSYSTEFLVEKIAFCGKYARNALRTYFTPFSLRVRHFTKLWIFNVSKNLTKNILPSDLGVVFASLLSPSFRWFDSSHLVAAFLPIKENTNSFGTVTIKMSKFILNRLSQYRLVGTHYSFQG